MEAFRLRNRGEVGAGGKLLRLFSSVGVAVVEYFSCKLCIKVTPCDRVDCSLTKA